MLKKSSEKCRKKCRGESEEREMGGEAPEVG